MLQPANKTYPLGASGVAYIGMQATMLYGALGAAVAEMSPGTMVQFSGTNINEMQDPPTGFDDEFDDEIAAGGKIGMLESKGNVLIPQWSGKGWFDPITGLSGFIGTAQGFVPTTPPGARSKAIYLDSVADLSAMFSNQWSPTNKNEAHCWDGNVSRPMNGRVYRRGYSSTQVWGMDIATRVWTHDFNTTTTDTIVTIEVFPEMNALVVVDAIGRVYTINPATGVNTLRGTVSGLSSYNVCMYVEAEQCVVFGGGNTGTKLYRMNAAGVISEIVQTYPTGLLVTASASGGSVVPHPGGQPAIVVASHTLNAFWKLDINTGVWSNLLNFPSGGHPTGFTGQATNAIAIAMHGTGAVLLIKGYGRSAGATQCQLWIFKVPA